MYGVQTSDTHPHLHYILPLGSHSPEIVRFCMQILSVNEYTQTFIFDPIHYDDLGTVTYYASVSTRQIDRFKMVCFCLCVLHYTTDFFSYNLARIDTRPYHIWIIRYDMHWWTLKWICFFGIIAGLALVLAGKWSKNLHTSVYLSKHYSNWTFNIQSFINPE